MWLFRKDPHVKPEGPLAFRVRVRTKSGEVVELRLSKSAEISPTGEGPRALRLAGLRAQGDRGPKEPGPGGAGDLV